MITLSQFGGRSGSNLFQYAFLRATAARLGTQFFCPPWEGDRIFCLGDEGKRMAEPSGITNFFDAYSKSGLIPEALSIGDHTKIQGMFQSEKYYLNSNYSGLKQSLFFKDCLGDRVLYPHSGKRTLP